MVKNQKGFSAVEGLLILIIVGILGGVGWYVWDSNKKTDDALNNTGNSQVIPSGKKSETASTSQKVELKNKIKTLATLEVPKDWKVKVEHKSIDNSQRQPSCSLTVMNTLVAIDYGHTVLPGVSESSGENAADRIVYFDIVKQPNTKPLEKYFEEDLYGGIDSGTHAFSKLTINGNTAVVYDGSDHVKNPTYKDQYYLVSDNGYVACLRWRYFDKGNVSASGGETNYDYSKYLGEVEKIAKSIKFSE